MNFTDNIPSFMKFGKITAAIAVAMVAVIACDHDKVVTDKVDIDIKEALQPGLKDSVTVVADVEFPVSGLADSVKNRMNETIVEAAFGSDYAGMEIRQAADRWAADYVNEFKETNQELIKEFGLDENREGTLNWENNLNGYFSGRYEDIISYTVNNYVYAGGAHGSTTENSVNMNRTTGKLVNESDFFIPGYREGLSAILSAHLRESLPDQESYDALFVKDIEPNGNFKVGESGITYIYGQYEIGPYYLGIIKVSVPWDELGDLVRENPLR